MKYDVSHLTNDALSGTLERLAHDERSSTLTLIVHLAEFDARKLHLAAAFPSAYRYCRAVLKLSEHEAYHRIVAARAGRRFPAVFDLLACAELSLTTVRLLAPHLTRKNHADLLAAARGKSKREVQTILAERFPKPDVPTSIRPLPAPDPPPRDLPTTAVGASAAHPVAAPDLLVPAVPAPDETASSSCERPIAPPPSEGPEPATPLSPGRYEFHFSGPAAAFDKLQRAQDLLRHAVPNGDVGEIFDRALAALLVAVEKRRFAVTARPRDEEEAPREERVPEERRRNERRHLRSVPASVERLVWTRDGGRCRFHAGDRRCESRSGLELHHVIPWEVGGPTTPENLALRCRAHNGYEADVYFGPLRRAHDAHLERSALPARARTYRSVDSARTERGQPVSAARPPSSPSRA